MFYSYPQCIWSNPCEGACLTADQPSLCSVNLQVRAEHTRMVSVYTATGSTQGEFSCSSRHTRPRKRYIFIQLKKNHFVLFFTFISAYPAHGYPPNSSYPNQGSWYSYPANGYAGGYTGYPGASAYWSNATDGPSSHSNMPTTPQPSQAMVQYPVRPRQPHSYLVQVNTRKLRLSCQP